MFGGCSTKWPCSETILETTLQKDCIPQTSELPTTSHTLAVNQSVSQSLIFSELNCEDIHMSISCPLAQTYSGTYSDYNLLL